MQLGLSQFRKLLWNVSLNIFHCANILKMFTENNKALTYIPNALFPYLPTIASSLFLLLKFYWRPDNNHNKTEMLTTLNYKTDNQHNLRNWNEGICFKRRGAGGWGGTPHFYLRSCPEISFLKLPTSPWTDILNPIFHCRLRNLDSEVLEYEQLFICEPGRRLVCSSCSCSHLFRDTPFSEENWVGHGGHVEPEFKVFLWSFPS